MIAMPLLLASALPAHAQAKPQQRPAASRPSRSIQIGGYAMAGRIDFAAVESFDAIFGKHTGPMFGGGARIGLPLGGLFVDIGASRFRAEGARVFVAGQTIFPLGIPVAVVVTPIEISAGWRFKIPRAPKLSAYAGGGLTSLQYEETSEFSTPAEEANETSKGYHLLGGAEYKITRWLGVAGEATWTTVPDAIGETGVSEAFNESNLGGRSFRLKITIGR